MVRRARLGSCPDAARGAGTSAALRSSAIESRRTAALIGTSTRSGKVACDMAGPKCACRRLWRHAAEGAGAARRSGSAPAGRRAESRGAAESGNGLCGQPHDSGPPRADATIGLHGRREVPANAFERRR